LYFNYYPGIPEQQGNESQCVNLDMPGSHMKPAWLDQIGQAGTTDNEKNQLRHGKASASGHFRIKRKKVNPESGKGR